MSDILMQSYVYHNGKCFFVSTINRESSAALAYGRIYSETIVWEYDYEKRARGSIIHQDEHCEGSITKHMLICTMLFQEGIPTEPEEE